MEEKLYTLTLPYYTGEDRTVRVYVPAHEEGERLPVIYMTDGQNLFEDDHPHQFGCWYTREAIAKERQLTGKAAVIVGIHNDTGPMQRTNELTPESIGAVRFPRDLPPEMRDMLLPQGEAFDDFVLRTVMPAIEARFPVEHGRNGAAFCGSSSGGLQAYFTALSHPDRFCMAGVFSPAFPLYEVEDIIRWSSSCLREKMPYLYCYSGAADPLEKEICDSTEQVYDALIQLYPPERLNAVILPEQRHHESAWAAIFEDFLHTFLLRREEL